MSFNPREFLFKFINKFYSYYSVIIALNYILLYFFITISRVLDNCFPIINLIISDLYSIKTIVAFYLREAYSTCECISYFTVY